MKKIFRLRVVVFISLFSLFLPVSYLSADAQLPLADVEPVISMDFKDASLKDILKVLSIQSGLNFIASEGLQDRKITLYLDKVPLGEAMKNLFNANNLSYELNEDANIFIVKDWGKIKAETITRVFYLKHATVSSSSLKEEMANKISPTANSTSGSTTATSSTSTGGTSGSSTGKWKIDENVGITESIKKLLSDAGSVIEDFRTNSLIVTDMPNRMKVIAQVIASLDIAVPQVLLEVEMLDVSKNTVDKIGIKYGQTPFVLGIQGAAESMGFPFGSWSKVFSPGSGTFGVNTATGGVAPNTYTAQLDFLRTATDTKYLARPKLLTLSNETAEIRITTNESIGVTTTTSETAGTTTATPERSQTGVSLRVTPQINAETGQITMFIYPEVSEAVAGNSFTSANDTFRYRDPEVRSTKTMVRIKDGDTVVLGGLIRNEFTRTTIKLPFLGDLPIIGGLFRHIGGGDNSSDKNKQRELLVFITAHIIKDKNIELAQAKKVALPEREQNTVSAAVRRENAINTTLGSFDKKKKY